MTDIGVLNEKIHHVFHEIYGTDPALTARAPGRVNLIGEHTDYNDGFVLPMAIDRSILFAAKERTDRKVNLHFLDFNSDVSFNIDQLEKGPAGPAEYIKGVAHFLELETIRLPGLDGVIAGSIPVSAGLSSSAALELAAARIFCGLTGITWDALSMACLAQKAENEWVGVNCGIMDQLICAAGQRGHAMLIDCRSLQISPTPLPDHVSIVIMDTNTRRSGHGLVDSAYGERRAQCEEAASLLGVPALRDSTIEELEAMKDALDQAVYQRARHVISENDRTLEAHRVMTMNNPAAMGELMDASHASLKHDFEVSTPALDTMASLAREHPACFGARMTGAGFGGCAVALVHSEELDIFMDAVASAYQEKTGLEPRLYACRAEEGVSLIT
jgi:galactokinase